MKIGIYTDMRNPPEFGVPAAQFYARWLDRFVAADERGAGAIWLSEHHFYDDAYLPQPLTFAAAVAAKTKHARIGTAVLLAALRHSLQLAEEAALVDIISNGRMDLGVGVGYRPSEYEAFGADIARRYPLVEKTVTEVREWWTGGRMTPSPVQDPVPLWGGFFGPRGARLAGKLGMGLLPQLSVSRSLLPQYLAGLAEGGYGRSGARLRFSMPFFIADDPELVKPIVADRLAYQRDSYARHDAGSSYGPKAPANTAKEGEEAGSGFRVLRPVEAAAWIAEATAGLPVDQVFCWASPGVMPDVLVDRHLELLMTEVAPRIAGLKPTLDPAIVAEPPSFDRST